MLETAVIIVLEAALLAAVVVLREPKLLIPAVALGLPIEYFGERYLDTLGQGGVSGAVRALLNPGKAAMLATIVVAVVRVRHDPRRLFPDSMVILPITALLALIVLGVAWSDSLHAPNSVLILPMYVAFVFVAPSLIEDRRDVERVVGALLIATCVLSALAVAQRIGGVFQWRTLLIDSDGTTYRSNATFSDPNHFARYLALTMSLALGLVLTTGPRRQTIYLCLPALGLGFLAIVCTASRSGWLMLAGCSFLVILAAPIARYTKFRLVGSVALAGGVGLAIILVQGGAAAERIRTLTSAVDVLGAREFLIKAGWHMFLDNPFVGVGSGNFQHALTESYLYLLPSWARTTLSHTSVVSILAELGVVGALMFGFVALRVAIAVVRAYYTTVLPYSRLLIAWTGIGLLGIVAQSQSEGRLLDDPYLWLLLALFTAFETSSALVGRQSAAAPGPVERVRPPLPRLRPATEPAGVDAAGGA